MKFLAVLLLVLVAVNAIPKRPPAFVNPHSYMQLFVDWQNKFEKDYEPLEFVKRFRIFKDNVDLVYDHNSHPYPFKLGLTKYADLTRDEFAAMVTPYYVAPAEVPEPRHTAPIATVVNAHTCTWTTNKTLTDMDGMHQPYNMDPWMCKCSYATAVADFMTMRVNDADAQVSPMELRDCGQSGDNRCVTNTPTPTAAFDFIFGHTHFSKTHNGTMSTTTRPYSDTPLSCLARYYDKAIMPLSGYGSYTVTSPSSTSGLHDVINGDHPAIVKVTFGDDANYDLWKLYSDGTYTGDPASSSDCGTGTHAYMLAVGFGCENGYDFIELKTPFGDGWGLHPLTTTNPRVKDGHGFIRIQVGNCGINDVMWS